MKYILALSILLSTNVFATAEEMAQLDQLAENMRRTDFERRVENMENQKIADDYARQMEATDRSILNMVPKVG